MPPSKGVPSGPWISASQRKMSSSETGPAVMPSGGEEVRSLYSWKRRRDAMEDAMLMGFRVEGGAGAEMWGGLRDSSEDVSMWMEDLWGLEAEQPWLFFVHVPSRCCHSEYSGMRSPNVYVPTFM